KQEELVLNQRPAHAKASHLAPVGRLEIRRRKHSRRSLDRDLRQRVGSAPDVVAIMEVSASMDLIGAALTNGVDHASRGAAVLRRVIRGVDLKLLDRFLGSRIANARTAAFFGEERLVIICSVKGVVIQQSAYAA